MKGIRCRVRMHKLPGSTCFCQLWRGHKGRPHQCACGHEESPRRRPELDWNIVRNRGDKES